MKANELRVGNLFNHIGVIRTLTDVEFEIRLKFGFDNCEPIPLTEEWLFKFGFHKYKGDNIDCFLNDFETACNIQLLFWKGNRIKNIRYVHQLQNLYFALTNEELKLRK